MDTSTIDTFVRVAERLGIPAALVLAGLFFGYRFVAAVGPAAGGFLSQLTYKLNEHTLDHAKLDGKHDAIDALMAGFATAATPANLLWALVGCALGTAVGVLPGIGPAVAVAMLLPITAKVEVTASMIFFAGIYYGAMYGGSTTPILLNPPGENANMGTAKTLAEAAQKAVAAAKQTTGTAS